MAIPVNKDVDLLNWSTNVDTRLTASPATYGTTAAVATQYSAVHDPFVAAYNALIAAREAGTRSESLTSIKDAARTALLDFARPLYRTIQYNTAVTDAAKIELGITIPDVEPTPIPVPGFAPGLQVRSVNGRLVSIRLFDPANPERKRFPEGVKGAIVMSFIGATAPTNPSLYKMEGPTTTVDTSVLFPEGTAPGTQVWLTALFVNERMQMGPACTAVGTQINYGGSMPIAA